MSIRVHELAKKIGRDNKETIEILKKYNLDVKSVSSTVDNITAEAVMEEYTVKTEEIIAQAPEPVQPKKPTLPPGMFVKSAEQVKKEQEEKEAARKTTTQHRVVAPPPTPAPARSVRPPAPAVPPPVIPKKSAPPPAPVERPQAHVAAAKPPATPPAVAPKVSSAPPPAAAPGAPRPAPAPTPIPTVKDTNAKEEADSEDIRKLQIKPPIVVKDFAVRLGMKPFRLISELMEMGIFSSMNQTIGEDIAAKIATQHGFILDIRHRGEGTVTKESQAKTKKIRVLTDDPESLAERPPVVCIMGHVDHGKTTLIDCIRKADVAAGEAGGITQHVAAYQVEFNKKKITFLDTPGHAAFSKIRERGANITDIVIIVVAADDGFMPQTDEALKFAKRSQAVIMVAINKIDAKGANIERVKQQMQERGIPPEDWGGETVCVPISALKGENIDQLLEMILLQSEVEELKANPNAGAEGIIVESQMEQGRGPTAIAIIDRGTLKPGDSLLCGTVFCKVRAMLDDAGNPVKVAPPSAPVKIVGWSGIPLSGGRFTKTKNDKEAKRLAEERLIEEKKEQAELALAASKTGETSLEALFAAIKSNQQKVLLCILKADVGGSIEAIRTSIQEIVSEKVSVKIISAEIGPVTRTDVTRANTAGATIIAFNVGVENGVRSQAKHEKVDIYPTSIIYELIDTVKDLMTNLLDPEVKEVHLGTAEVRQLFSVGKRVVAGCMIVDGKIHRDKPARLLRDGEIVGEAKIDTLRRFKDDVNEVRTGFECGIRVYDIDSYQEGDRIECYDIEKIKPLL